MQNILLLFIILLEIAMILIGIYSYHRSKKKTKILFDKLTKETEELRNKCQKQTEELRSRCRKQIEELERVSALFLEDGKYFEEDEEFENWKIRIMQVCQEAICERVLGENDETSKKVYSIFKEYEEWRKQKLG